MSQYIVSQIYSHSQNSINFQKPNIVDKADSENARHPEEDDEDNKCLNLEKDEIDNEISKKRRVIDFLQGKY